MINSNPRPRTDQDEKPEAIDQNINKDKIIIVGGIVGKPTKNTYCFSICGRQCTLNIVKPLLIAWLKQMNYTVEVEHAYHDETVTIQ